MVMFNFFDSLFKLIQPRTNRNMNIAIQFPFEDTNVGGRFKTTRTTRDAIKTNLVSLMLTKPGQRPMRANVYSPFWHYIFDPYDAQTESLLDEEVRTVVADVMPEIDIEQLLFDFDENTKVLHVTFGYSIKAFGSISDQVIIPFQFQPQEF